jgi:hypothetical protein
VTVLIIIGSVLLGAILGRFFKVLVLLPAFALSLAIVLASSAYFGHSLSRTFIELVALVVSLQLGYVSGLLSSFIRNLRQAGSDKAGSDIRKKKAQYFRITAVQPFAPEETHHRTKASLRQGEQPSNSAPAITTKITS